MSRIYQNRASVVTRAPLLSRGGELAASRRSSEATIDVADGVVWSGNLDHTTPSARTNDASRLFLDRAATPPLLRRGVLALVALACLSLASALLAQDPRTIVEEAQKRSVSMSQRYEGTLKVIDNKSKVTEKRWNFDRIGSHGDSKSMLRFSSPADVKGVALLVFNHPDRSSDQWMWTPAVGRERRIAIQDRSQRFFGTDFSFEDLEERDTDQFDYRLLAEETLDGTPTWKIESRPRQKKVSQYSHSHVWVRKDNYVMVQIENFSKGKLVRRAKYSNIQRVQNIWTAHNIEMFDVKRDSRTILSIEKLQYNLPMKDEEFTIQAMRRER